MAWQGPLAHRIRDSLCAVLARPFAGRPWSTCSKGISVIDVRNPSMRNPRGSAWSIFKNCGTEKLARRSCKKLSQIACRTAWKPCERDLQRELPRDHSLRDMAKRTAGGPAQKHRGTYAHTYLAQRNWHRKLAPINLHVQKQMNRNVERRNSRTQICFANLHRDNWGQRSLHRRNCSEKLAQRTCMQ